MWRSSSSAFSYRLLFRSLLDGASNVIALRVAEYPIFLRPPLPRFPFFRDMAYLHPDKVNYKVPDQKHSDDEASLEKQIGKNISSADKRKFLINTLLDLKDSKEVVYGTLDAWIAWENNFPLARLKSALVFLEKEQQWHRIVQVIKWMLSKGQGRTMATYEQLIRALEKDNRTEEAHRIWVKNISHDLHSVPWRFCELMISIYYRNNMLERLVKLFQELEEEYGRKPPSKSIVRKVGDAYELLGLLEKKNKLLEKYDDLINAPLVGCSQKSRRKQRVSGKKGKETETITSKAVNVSDDVQVNSGQSGLDIEDTVEVMA